MYTLITQIFAKHLLCLSSTHHKEARKNQKQILSSQRRGEAHILNKLDALFKVVGAISQERTGENWERKDNVSRLPLS